MEQSAFPEGSNYSVSHRLYVFLIFLLLCQVFGEFALTLVLCVLKKVKNSTKEEINQFIEVTFSFYLVTTVSGLFSIYFCGARNEIQSLVQTRHALYLFFVFCDGILLCSSCWP